MSGPYIGLHHGNSGWPVHPQAEVVMEATTEKHGVPITLQKIEYVRRYHAPAPDGTLKPVEEKLVGSGEYALMLPSGYKMYSRTSREELSSLLAPEDEQYLATLAQKGLLIERYTNSFGQKGFKFIEEE